jgi:PhzF family phenazine biosynthesis protein
MEIPVYQVDAFTTEAFGGNPAAICPLDDWLPDATMQTLAMENNLSETAFLVGRGGGEYDLRWFTPGAEVDLCGHATLATAWVLFERLGEEAPAITFHTKSGPLNVSRQGGRLVMDFPALPPKPEPMPDGLVEALGREPVAFLRALKNMAIFDSEADVRAITPDFNYIADMEGMGLIITAPGDASDCASRFFAPKVGINEDPVTGSAHCTIVPYWSERLGKTDIYARQVSARGGDLYCRYQGDRVEMAGNAVMTMQGAMMLG